MKHITEILSPAGDMDAAKAAILAGADAIYMGVEKFNARVRAENISEKSLPSILRLAHDSGVRVYVTLNILLTEQEVPEALELANRLFTAGADALIVQDMGLAWVLKQNFPEGEIHASTQMTTLNCLQTDFINRLGMVQVNLSRELSEHELSVLNSHVHDRGMKSEIFVHGAYCVSCSGVCYMSSFMHAQSGNRGACLQPCRRKYSIKKNSNRDYLLSLKDNNALNFASALVDIGADCLKIEGRIKGYNYVYEVTRAWRQEVNRISGIEMQDGKPADVANVFNRDFSTGYFEGEISGDMFVNSPLDQSLVPKGIVESYSADKRELLFRERGGISEGDRLSIYTAENEFICTLIVESVFSAGRCSIKIENKLRGKIEKGQLVMALPLQNQSLSLLERIRGLEPEPHELTVSVSGKEGEPLCAEFLLDGKAAAVTSSVPLQKSQKLSLGEDILREQFRRLDDPLIFLGKIDCTGLEPGLFLPLKELNRMRRDALDAFKPLKDLNISPVSSPSRKPLKKIAILVNDADYESWLGKGFDGPVFLEAGMATDPERISEKTNLWLPQFILDGEVDHYRSLIKCVKPELVVSDNSGLGLWCAGEGVSWIGGPQLNICNSMAMNALEKEAGAAGGFYSPELNKHQLSEIPGRDGVLSFYTVFGPVLMMTSRQCFFLKPGLCRQGRAAKDGKCRAFCENYSTFYDEKNVPFHVVKNRGFLNRIYNDSLLFLPQAVKDLDVDYFLLDLRGMPFYSLSRETKMELVNFFRETAKGNNGLKEGPIKEKLPPLTYGNYRRGF